MYYKYAVGVPGTLTLLCVTKGTMAVGPDGARQFSWTHLLVPAPPPVAGPANGHSGYWIANECFRFV
jgi:hypothetical protein